MNDEKGKPVGYIDQALADARANDPRYLTDRELRERIEAREAKLGGDPF